MEPVCHYFKTTARMSPIFVDPGKNNFRGQLSSTLPYINLLLKELCIEIFDRLNYLDQNNFGLSCRNFYLLSKNAPMWFKLHKCMSNFILLHSVEYPLFSYLNNSAKNSPVLTSDSTIAPDPLKVQALTHKDVVCRALKESKPEALLAKCMFFFDNNNIYTKKDYLRAYDQILLIKKNESEGNINSSLKIKADLLHAELFMILKVECGVTSDDEYDFYIVRDLIVGVLNNKAASAEEKNWAKCLGVQLYYYTHNGLVYGSIIDDLLFKNSFEEVLDDLQKIIHHTSSSTSCKAIANLYKALIGYCGIMIGAFNEPEIYELFRRCMDKSVQTSYLPLTYQAKCILQMALMDYHIDSPNGNEEENEKLFGEFNNVIQNECAFPHDKTIAMLYQAIMRYRDLSNTITYQEAEQLLDQIIEDKVSSSKNVITARMYKASMNFANQTKSMTKDEIFDAFEKFVSNEDIHIKREDRSLAMVNMGLMLVQKLVERIGSIRAAFSLFTQVSQIVVSTDNYTAKVELQYIALAKKELALFELSYNGRIRRSLL